MTAIERLSYPTADEQKYLATVLFSNYYAKASGKGKSCQFGNPHADASMLKLRPSLFDVIYPNNRSKSCFANASRDNSIP
jgi:hypothetical protein